MRLPPRFIRLLKFKLPTSFLLATVLGAASGCQTVNAPDAMTKQLSFPSAADLPPGPLTDPLLTFQGGRITTAGEWDRKRRPELKALFAHYMYGTMPPAPKASFKVERVDKNFFHGKATEKLVTIFLGADNAPSIHLLLLVPNHRSQAAPVFVGPSFSGIYSLVDDPLIPLPSGWMFSNPSVVNNRAVEAGRGQQKDVWAIEQSIDRGYAVAVFYYGDVEPDRPDATEGIRAWYRKQNPTADYDWGAVAAWAWGISRVVDYLVTDRDLDAKKISVVGHSRNGKAAILAGALDERIALVIPLQAGCGGTSPSRGKIGESVQRINTSFPHWFNAEFKKFNEQPERLPFDQHCLVALCAPRPVLLSNATEDTWANPAGQFEMLQAAEPVYRLFAANPLAATQMPPLGKLIDSRLGYYIRSGKHSMTAGDWKIFLDFADKQFGKPR